RPARAPAAALGAAARCRAVAADYPATLNTWRAIRLSNEIAFLSVFGETGWAISTRQRSDSHMTVETRTSGFRALGVSDAVCNVLDELGIEHPFPVQSAVVPEALRGGDVLAKS